MWAEYSGVSSNSFISSDSQKLVNDINVLFYGSSGVSGDSWSFTPKYNYKMDNIIDPNTNKIWRSTSDNVTQEIIIDMGSNSSIYADGVALDIMHKHIIMGNYLVFLQIGQVLLSQSTYIFLLTLDQEIFQPEHYQLMQLETLSQIQFPTLNCIIIKTMN